MHMFIARYSELLHVDISCDGCDEIAPWHRYRCLQCSDMDLCTTCFLGTRRGPSGPCPEVVVVLFSVTGSVFLTPLVLNRKTARGVL